MFNGSSWASPTDPFLGDTIPKSATTPAADTVDGGVTCLSTTFCYAFSSYLYSSFFTGTGWTPPIAMSTSSTAGTLYPYLSCTSVSWCYVQYEYGSAVAFFTNGQWGAAFAPFADPAINESTASLLCSSTEFCIDESNTGWIALFFQGNQIAGAVNPFGSTPYNGIGAGGIVCASQYLCIAGSDTDQYNEWHTPAAPYYVATLSGTTWSAPILGEVNQPSASCATATLCFMLESGSVSSFNGSVWSAPVNPFSADGISSDAVQSVDCASASSCLATSLNGMNSEYDGTAWSAPLATAPPCWDVQGACYTLQNGEVSFYNGSTWSTPINPFAGDGASGDGVAVVECPSASMCDATSSDGFGSIFNGSTWSPADNPFGPANSISTLQCSDVSTCWATAGPETQYQPDGSPITPVSSSDPSQSGCSCDQAQPSTGEPVNTASGAFLTSAPGLSVSGAGVPLQVSASYNSAVAQSQVDAGQAPGPLGYGWDYNLGMSVSVNATTGIATVTEENGAQITFAPYSPETSPWWCTSADNYCGTAPRSIATLEHNADGTWTFTRKLSSPLTFTFGSSGSLIGITDAAGQELTEAPGSPGTGQCPSSASTCQVWTSSVSQRSITLAFDASGDLDSATDQAGQSTSFCHYGQTCASSSGGLAGDLASVTQLSGTASPQTTAYSYDSTNAAADLQHDLTVIVPPSGQTTAELDNTYDSAGRVVNQVLPGGSVLTFGYSGSSYATGNGSAAGGSTTVTTYPDGTGSGAPSSVDVYNYVLGVLQSESMSAGGTAVGQPQTFNRDLATLQPTSHTDANGAVTAQTIVSPSATNPSSIGDVLTSIDGVGDTTQYQYTADNLPWCKVDPAEYLAGVRCPASQPSSPPAQFATGAWSDPARGASLTFYNAADQVTFSVDPLGHVTENQYTSGIAGVPDGLLYCSIGPVAYAAGTTCAPYGSPPNRGTSTRTFDAAGDVLTSVDADGNTTTNCYYSQTTGCAASAPASGDGGNPTLLYSTTDPDGATTTYTYNVAGEVLSQTQSFRGFVATSVNAYDALGRKFCSVAPAQVAKKVTCPATPPTTPPTPSPNPTATTDPYLGATITTYDALGQVIQTTSPTGGVSLSAYDASGNQVCSVGPLAAANGVTCATAVPPAPSNSSCTPTPLADPDPGATVDFYNSLGQVVQETNPLGGTTLYTYDPDGNKTCQTVSSNDATHAPPVTTGYTYDGDNRVVKTIVAPSTSLSETSLSFYDPNGDVYCSVSPAAYAKGSTGYQCPSWTPSWINTPPSPSSLYSSTPSSAQANNVTTSFFDADGNQAQQTTATGGTTVTTYDGAGRAVCSIAPSDFATWLAGNPSGSYPYACPVSPPTAAPTGVTGTSTTLYDPAGRAVSTTDPVGNTTTTTYGPDGEKLVVTAPGDQVTTNCYYWETATCASAAPSAGGEANSLYSVTLPGTTAGTGGPVTTYTYLPGGATLTTTTVSGSTTDEYDQAGHLVSKTNTAQPGYALTPNVSYTYGPDGSRSSMTDGNGVTSYSYDDMGDVTKQQFVPSTGSTIAASTTTHTYFTNGAVETIGYPATAADATPTVTHAYDQAGNLVSVTDWLGHTTTIAHDANGNVSSTAYPNGTQVSAVHDLSGGTTSISAATSATPTTPLLAFSYQRNSADQVTTQTATGAISSTDTYTYDPNQRLGSVNSTSAAYDPASDPTALGTGATQTFNGAGQVMSSTVGGLSTNLTYNTAGDRASAQQSDGAGTQYTYDQNNQLVSSTATPATPPLTGLRISAGYDHSLGLAANGTVWAWGNNGNGQLGDGTITSSSVPVEVSGLTNVISVSAGYEASVAVEANGTVWTWGNNSDGQLGNGTTTNSDVPVQVTGLSGVTSVSAGGFTMLALTSTGSVWAWGDNTQGELGNGTTTNSDVPVQVTGLSTVTSISSGFWFFSSALESNGTVWSWGYNADGQLGNGTTTSSDVPTEVTGIPAASAIASGGTSSLALGTNGTVWSWGSNVDGQLGDGSTSTSAGSTPIQVPGISATGISAGLGTSLALQASGAVLAWGDNSNGQLGNGSTTNSSTPAPMQNIANGVAITTGGYHTLVLESNGSIAAVGGNNSGQLGNGTTNDATVPTSTIDWNAATGGVLATTTYTYNGDGIRVGEASSKGRQTFVWDSTGSTPQLLSDGNYEFIYGDNGQVLEQVSGAGTPEYFIQGQLGSTRALMDASGAIVATYTYDAYGAVTSHTGSASTPIGFAGGYTDPSGLIYLIHRYYDPATGQFLGVDPLVQQTMQPYQYAGNDPVNASDPSGLCWHSFLWACPPTTIDGGRYTKYTVTGLYASAVTGDQATIGSSFAIYAYTPFYRDVSAGINTVPALDHALKSLWTGLYGTGEADISMATAEQRLFVTPGGSASNCGALDAPAVDTFVCYQTAVLSYPLYKGLLGNDIQAFQWYGQLMPMDNGSGRLSPREGSIAYLIYHQAKQLLKIGQLALNLYQDILKKDTNGDYATSYTQSACSQIGSVVSL